MGSGTGTAGAAGLGSPENVTSSTSGSGLRAQPPTHLGKILGHLTQFSIPFDPSAMLQSQRTANH
jgi:hypothetical protein